MHSLLRRQLKKYLSADVQSLPEIEAFLKAVEKSYENYDEKLAMLHRATSISSDELYEANKQLESEFARQKNILTSLENAIGSLTDNLKEEQPFGQNMIDEFNAEHLADYISNLAFQVAQMNEEKDRFLKSLEEQNQALNSYAQMVSHDLKSPIRNINALMSWIMEDEKDKFSDSSKENCSLVSKNLEKMDKLISGILNHATLGKTEEQRVGFELKDALKEIVRTIYVPDNVKIVLADNLPKMVFERARLEQLFMNLLTNAISATEKKEQGLIEIGYEPDDLYWKFIVSDNGKGIPEQYQESIFEMFKKLENEGNGTGIGLALVKKIVDLYDGCIRLKSEEGIGTIFYITLKKEL
ncbi:HAMP domain-containing histidine kinase [Maribacter sp. MMG018]|uniref:sensor histidine kinase n=1 Tax=Maribacter sp. MMG018 TaxID=2822688 RepID=UPI001B38EFDD|nr:HAMP domain-containing sensor histidine kinase [Maribacter sp. MMG018]MBQ4914663.1 HAMP domain-containing histidine kinase [Maribacter sp. MMG018]